MLPGQMGLKATQSSWERQSLLLCLGGAVKRAPRLVCPILGCVCEGGGGELNQVELPNKLPGPTWPPARLRRWAERLAGVPAPAPPHARMRPPSSECWRL